VTPTKGRIRHHFTVDVEEYFQVSALAPYVPRSTWESIPSRIDRGMHTLLDLLARRSVHGTFFVLGWVAKHHPRIVREIVAGGHEIASHGWGHERVPTLSPGEFRESVRDSKAVLEDLAAAPVLGYRAPSFSILRGGEWALDILIDEGYRYDSSLVPSTRGDYGYVGGKPDPYRLVRTAGTLEELPPTTLRIANRLQPMGGGAYFRIFPWLVGAALRSCERRGVPGTFYIHPWELDPDQPVHRVALKTRIRHYWGLSKTAERIQNLLEEFEFQPIATTLG
jgi:polysaccharide deacetylase family protein (PEP-CTERM system associated)